jgi:dTMP kinase
MMGRKAVLICFVGIDGSGKTTLAKSLVSSLKQKGIVCHYMHSRFQLFMFRPIVWIGRLLFLRRKGVTEDFDKYSHVKRTFFKNRFHSLIYERLLLFEHCLQAVFKIRIPLLLGRNIICDRYIYDSVITDLAVDMSYSLKKIIRLLSACLIFCPKPNLVFLVDIPVEIANKRKHDIPSMKYLTDRKKLYLEVGRDYKMTILDGTRDLIELESIMVNKVLQSIN